MTSTAETDLLQASLTGEMPAQVEDAFTSEREKGNESYRNGSYEAAIQHYTNAELINPLSPLPPANRSMVYLKMRNWQRAREEAAMALELQNALPSHLHSKLLAVKLHLRRATACEQLMLFALAVDDYQSVLKIDSHHLVARKQFERLSHKYRITVNNATIDINHTAPEGKSRSQSHSERPDRIRVVSEEDAPLNTSSIASDPTTSETPPPNGVKKPSWQEGSELFALPTEVIENIAAQSFKTAPQTAAQFEHAWRCLRDPAAQVHYLLNVVGATRIRNGFIGDGLTAQMLERVVYVLSEAVLRDASCSDNVADLLSAFAHVGRFDLLIMFLSDVEKRPFVSLIERLRDNGVDDRVLRRLQEAYR